MNIIDELYILRQQLNIKKTPFAKSIQMAPSMLNALEQGTTDTTIRLPTLERWVDALGMRLTLVPKERQMLKMESD